MDADISHVMGATAVLGDEWVFGASGGSLAVPKQRRALAAVLAGLLVAVLAGVFVVKQSGDAEAAAFKYTFAAGEQRSYDLQMSINVTPEGVPDAQAFTGKVAATLRFLVAQQQEDGSTVIELALSNVVFDPPTSTLPFDSGTMRVRMSPEGRVTSVDGAGGIFGAAGGATNSLLAAPSGAPSDTAGSQFFFPPFPANALKSGDTWNERTTLPFPFGDDEITINTTGELAGFEDSAFGRVARVRHAITAPMDLSFSFGELAESIGQSMEGAPSGFESAKFVVKGDTVMNADSLVLPETSDIVQMTGKAEMTMTMALEGVAAAAGSAPMTLKSVIDMSIVRLPT